MELKCWTKWVRGTSKSFLWIPHLQGIMQKRYQVSKCVGKFSEGIFLYDIGRGGSESHTKYC